MLDQLHEELAIARHNLENARFQDEVIWWQLIITEIEEEIAENIDVFEQKTS
jgi:23S rRNA G2445 N2-methylase RlmL